MSTVFPHVSLAVTAIVLLYSDIYISQLSYNSVMYNIQTYNMMIVLLDMEEK